MHDRLLPRVAGEYFANIGSIQKIFASSRSCHDHIRKSFVQISKNRIIEKQFIISFEGGLGGKKNLILHLNVRALKLKLKLIKSIKI